MSEVNYLNSKDELVKHLERWSHRINELKRIMDSGILHQKCIEIADELMSNPKDPLWEQIKNYPDRLL